MASVSRCCDLASFEKMLHYLNVVAPLSLFLDADVMVFISLILISRFFVLVISIS